MAEGKKSFVLYTELIHTVGKLPDEIAGKLFKHILEYVNDLNPESEDLLLNIAFEPIKQNLKRDLEKWQNLKIKRSQAGKRSAEVRANVKSVQQTPTSVKNDKQRSTKPAVNGNVNGNANGSVNGSLSKEKNIVLRKTEFCHKLKPFVETYGQPMIDSFADYWTQQNENGKKMHFEKQKTFQINLRLKSWKRNENSKANTRGTTGKSLVEIQFGNKTTEHGTGHVPDGSESQNKTEIKGDQIDW